MSFLCECGKDTKEAAIIAASFVDELLFQAVKVSLKQLILEKGCCSRDGYVDASPLLEFL